MRIDKKKSLSFGILLRALGFDDRLMLEYFGESDELKDTIEKSKVFDSKEALDILFRTIRRGDRVSDEALQNLLANLFFNERRYSLSNTGRFLLNAKLSVYDRIVGTYLAKDLLDVNGELFMSSGTYISSSKAKRIKEGFDSGKLPLVRLRFARPSKDDPNLFEYKNKNPEVYGYLGKSQPEILKYDEVAMVYVHRNSLDFDSGKQPLLVIGNNPR